MGTCELCGMEKVTTRKTRASSTIVDCCNRCIETLSLQPIQDFTNKFTTGSNSNSILPIQNNMVGAEREELISNFHIKIREKREFMNFSQEDLAKKCNERVNIIQKIENGNRVTDSVLKKVEKILDLKIYDSIMPNNERSVKSKVEKIVTISDANILDQKPTPTKIKKKKTRKLGVTRSGGRKKKRE